MRASECGRSPPAKRAILSEPSTVDRRTGRGARAVPRFAASGDLGEWNREKQISGIVFDLQTGARGIAIALARYKLPYEQMGEAACPLFVWQMCPPYIGILIVFPSHRELIYRHGRRLRDTRPDAA
jgi:hypothetical protein